MTFQIKPGRETSTKTFRLPVDLVKKLEDMAYTNNLSLNALVVQCLDFVMCNMSEDPIPDMSDENPESLQSTSHLHSATKSSNIIPTMF